MDPAEWLALAAVVVPTVAVLVTTAWLRGDMRTMRGDMRTMHSENEKANDKIGERIKGTAAAQDRRFDARFDQVDRQIADINDRSRRRLRAMIDAEL